MDDYLTSTIAGYDEKAKEYALQSLDHGPREERDRFVSFIPPHGSILDVGCGSGRDSGFFADQGFQVHGIDLSENLLVIAKSTYPNVTFSKEDIRHVAFAQNSFDGIWSCMSLVHIKHDDVPLVLESFYNILKPNGILFLYVKKGYGETLKEEPSAPGLKRFYSLFQIDQLRHYITDAQFTIIDCYENNKKSTYASGVPLSRIACFCKKIA